MSKTTMLVLAVAGGILLAGLAQYAIAYAVSKAT